MNKRYVPVSVVCLVFAIVSLVGYLTPEARPEIPVRVLLENSGGPVVFAHQRHEAYDLKCVQCHHSTKVSTTEVPCGICHPGDFDEEFVREHVHWFEGKAACATCHHLEWGRPIFDHPLHEEVAECEDCHHGEPIEDEYQNCRNCHGKIPEGGSPALRDAVHTRCRTCHDDMYEEELVGCSNCHSRKHLRDMNMEEAPKCGECHTKPNAELIPPRQKAFHDQCMGCHRKRGKGPYRNREDVKDCGMCHLPQ